MLRILEIPKENHKSNEVLLSQASVGDLFVKITHFRARERENSTNKSCAENIRIIYLYITLIKAERIGALGGTAQINQELKESTGEWKRVQA